MFPKGFRFLSSLIVVTGAISLFGTAMSFWWIASDKNAIFPVSVLVLIGPILFYAYWLCAISFIAYCLLYIFRWRKTGYAFSKIALIIFVLTILAQPALSSYNQQKVFAERSYLITVDGVIKGSASDSVDIIKQKYLLNRLRQEIGANSYGTTTFSAFQPVLMETWTENAEWYQTLVKDISCKDKPIYHLSPNGDSISVLLKRCDSSGKYFCFAMMKYKEGNYSGGEFNTTEAILSESQDGNYYCGGKPVSP